MRAQSLLLVATSAALFLACSSDPPQNQPDGGAGGPGGGPPGACSPIGADNELPPLDPRAEGQCLFLYETWGTEALDEWPPVDFMVGLLQSEAAFFGPQFSNFGFLPDPNDDLPIGLKRGTEDPTKLHETCAMCHVGELPDGRLWLGAPNGALDPGRFKVEINKRWVAAGHPSLMTPLGEQKALELGPGRVNSESSDYPDVVAADFPPYFSLAQRTHLNYLGTGGNVRTEVYLSIYSFGAGSPNDETAKVPFPTDMKLDTFLAFFGAMGSPAGPAGDQALITQGKAVFDAASCGSCHHVDDISKDDVVTYDKTAGAVEHLPGEDPMFPRGTIRTDGQHRVLVDGNGPSDAGAGDGGIDQGYIDLIQFIVKHNLQAGATDGYRPSDLHGVWATAPYLHNGSVPTLEDLLSPAASRPAMWMRNGFLIDTQKLGNGAMGHEFGASLSAPDKTALIAYLKSL